MVKAFALAILALLSAGCTGRSLTRQQMAGIAQLDVIVGAAPSNPFARVPQPSEPTPIYRPTDTSKGFDKAAGQAIADAFANASAKADISRRQDTMLSAAASVLHELRAYEFAPDLLAATRQQLGQVTSVRLEVRSPALASRAEGPRRAAYHQSSASAVLFFDVEYSLVELYGVDYAVMFNATAAIFPKTDELKKLRRRPDDANPLSEDNAIYRKEFEFSFKYGRGNLQAMFGKAAQELAARLAAELGKAR